MTSSVKEGAASMRKLITWIICIVLLLTALLIGLYNHFKKLPPKLSYEGDLHHTEEIRFLHDLTYKDKLGEMKVEQEIFSAVWQLIDDAEDFIVVDMFLFHDDTDIDRDFPDLTGTFTDKLIEKRKEHPDMPIVFITDPINTGYYSYEPDHFKRLKEHNIEVVLTELDPLHDSNKPYTSVWRMLAQPFGFGTAGWLPNPFAKDAPKLTLRSYLKLFNVKANHRKAIVSEKSAIIQSANPHNESGFAANIAFEVSGNVIRDIVEAEQAVIDYSGGKTKITPPAKQEEKGDIAVQYLTEGKILKHVVQAIDEAEKDESIWVGMFYIANRSVVDALAKASDRGVDVRLILDPNQNAFGNNKTGLPNVPIANELNKSDKIQIRWYKPGEDQYHTKIILVKKEDKSIIIGGSANYTTRNLDDLNLENDLKIIAPNDSQVLKDVESYFERLWANKDGDFTADYETNQDALTPMLRLTYWVQKATGLTTY